MPARPALPWYAQVTPYQWLVLVIASAGWVFDAFEGQLFNITRGRMLPDLLGVPAQDPLVKLWGDRLLAVFLVGGTLGGVLFGMLADRFGRKPTMAATILFYSVFSGLTYFVTDIWQVAVLRFLVALGVGGEWAVAASLVAEVFPPAARARAAAIFHATSVFGTWLAALAGLAVGAEWRLAYLIGVAPALLVLGVRAGLREPERWERTEAQAQRRGSLAELFRDRRWARAALLGMALAAVGLGTFWGVTIAGQDLAREMLLPPGTDADEAARRAAEEKATIAFGIVQTAGGGLGLLAFGPLAERIGRRWAFTLMHALSLIIVPVACYVPQTYEQLLALLPVFGFITLSIHAGYAIYFPELFPDRLRATGVGVCFNGGRLLAAPILFWVSAELKASALGLKLAITLLSSLFLVGLVLVWFLPETRGKPLPE